MKCYELVKDIVENHKYDMEKDDIKKLIAIAYYYGREQAVREFSEEVNKVLKDQQERVQQCRYKNMAMKIQGNISNIYSADHSGEMTNIFGADKTNITLDKLENII
jgi:ATP-dependent Lon protease